MTGRVRDSPTSTTTQTGDTRVPVIDVPEQDLDASRRRKNILLLLTDCDITGVWTSALEKWGLACLSPTSLEGVNSDLKCIDLAVLDVEAFNQFALLLERIPVIGVGSQMGAGAIADYLEAGVEDFIDKSCCPRELVARVRAILRRSGRAPVETHTRVVSGWMMDLFARRLLTPDGGSVELTESEFLLTRVFIENPNKVFSPEELAAKAFLGQACSSATGISRIISALQLKLKSKKAPLRLIETARQRGYCLIVATDGVATIRG